MDCVKVSGSLFCNAKKITFLAIVPCTLILKEEYRFAHDLFHNVFASLYSTLLFGVFPFSFSIFTLLCGFYFRNLTIRFRSGI